MDLFEGVTRHAAHDAILGWAVGCFALDVHVQNLLKETTLEVGFIFF